MYGFKQTIPPANRAIDLELAKGFIHVGHDHDDELITLMIDAVSNRAEDATHRQLLTATYTMTLDDFPVGRKLKLPKSPIQSVTSINYVDTADVVQPFTDFALLSDREPGEIFSTLETDMFPNDVMFNRPGAVTIVYVAGYGLLNTDIPAELRQGMLIALRHAYDIRSEIGGTASDRFEVPQTTNSIFKSFDIGDVFELYGSLA